MSNYKANAGVNTSQVNNTAKPEVPLPSSCQSLSTLSSEKVTHQFTSKAVVKVLPIFEPHINGIIVYILLQMAFFFHSIL